MTKSDAFMALEGFNAGICALSGAGPNGGLENMARYRTLLAIDADEARELITAARKADDAREHQHYIDGFEGTLERAIAAEATP